jgi:hypothetical protein
MAKNFWENDPLAEEASFWKDDPIVEIEAPKVEEPQQSSKFRRYIADPALGLSKGVVGAVEGAVGLADIPTFGAAGKGAEMLEKGVFGGTTKDLQDYLQSLKTPEQIREEQLASEGKGFLGTLKSYAQHPAAIANVIEETIPSMVGGAGLARGAMKLRPGLSAVKAGALGEGAITAGQIAEQTRQQQESGFLNPEQVAISTTAGVLTGVLGNFGGRVAQKLGFNDIDTILAGGIGQAEKKSVIKSAIQSGLAESTLEELPQSMQEQIAQNINLGRPWDEGVAEAGATGALAGFAMAGVGGGYSQAVQNTRVAERDTRLKQEEVARQRKLESIDAERARIDQIVLDAQNEADIQKAKDEAKKFAVEELNTLGNKAPEKSRIAKSIAAMEVSFNKAIEQGDIDAQKKAIAELTNIPTNIVSLATQPNVITDQTFADMGIGSTATIRRKKELHGLDPQIPAENEQIRNALSALLETKEERSKQYEGIKKYLNSIPTTQELKGYTKDETTIPEGSRESVEVSGQPVAGGLTAGVEGVDGTGLGGTTDNVQQLAGREGPRPAPLAPETTEVLKSEKKLAPAMGIQAALKQSGGINTEHLFDLTGERSVNKSGATVGLFTKNGRGLDDAVQVAVDKGYLNADVLNEVDGGVGALSDLLIDEIQGKKAVPLDQQADAELEAYLAREQQKADMQEVAPSDIELNKDVQEIAAEEKGRDILFAGPKQQLGERNPIFDKVTNAKQLFKAVMKIADTRSDKAIINMLERVPNLDTVKVITENTSTDPELQGAAGYYDPNTNTIFIDPRVADLSHITLHEIAHAATDAEFDKHVKIVNNVHTPITPLGKKMVKLFDAFMAESLKKQEGFYGQKNVKEFFMESYTDNKLKNFLQNRAGVLGLKPAKGKVATLWSDFVNLIKSMFGIPEYAHSMLDEILLLSPELMKGPGAVTTGKEIVQARQTPEGITRPDGSPIKYIESDNDSLWQKTKNAYDSKRKWLDLLGNKIIGNRYSVERKGIDANLPEVDAFRQGRIRGDLINLQATNGQSLAQSGLYRGRLDVRKSGMIIADESTGDRKVGMLDISKAWYELIDRATQDLGSKELAYDMLTAGWYGPRYADLEQYNSTVPKDEQIDISEWTDSDKRTAAEAQRRYGDELKDIRDMRNIQRKDLLDFMVKSGLYTQDKAQKYLDRMDYVALYRVPENEIDQFDTSPIGRSAGLLGAGKEYRLLGSKRAAADPIDNYIQNMSWMMQRGIRNNAAIHTADMLQDIGQGQWFDRPATDLEKKSQNIVTLFVDGKKKDFKVNDLNDMAAFTGSPIVSGFVWDLMKYPVSGLRHGITMMPQFVWNQAWEDPIRATISSGNKAGFAKNIKDTWTSIANNQFKSERTPNADLLNRYGIVGQKDVLDSADVINMYKGKDKSGWKKYVLYLERMAQGSDLGARESIFKNAVDELTKQGYDLETAQDYAAVRAHQYMPYQQVGTSKSLAYLRRMMPFVNPPIQGLARDIAAARGRVGNMTRKEGRNALAWRLAKYAMFTGLYAAFMSGDDEYENQSDEQQDNNFFIGGARIPVPQELKPLKVAIERGTRAWVLNAPKSDMEDGAIAAAVLRKMWEVVAGFAPIPTAFRPLIETKGNYNIFSGLPIVSAGQQRKEPAYQYNDKTSEIARYLGKTLNYSPIKIDHLIKGYGGYMGSTLAQATNYLADDKPAPTINDMLFIGSMLENQQATGSRSDFYNLYDKVTTAKATAKAIINEGDKERYREYVQEHKGELAIAPAINNLHNQINKLRDSKKLIMRSNRSPEEKRAALDKLLAAENRVLNSVKKLEAKAIEINER